MNKNVSLSQTVLKLEKPLFASMHEIIRDRGVLFFLKKSLLVCAKSVYYFFREYLPLHILSLWAKNGEITTSTIHGYRMTVNLNDVGISHELALYGVHERESSQVVKKIIEPGMTILEIGANIGYYAILEARNAGASGHLYAVEPSPFNVALLKKNLARNNIKNADVYAMAIGEQNTTLPFFIAEKSNLSSFIDREAVGTMDGTTVDVNVQTLDAFLADKKPVDFIRMDVEGYEWEILQGAEKILSQATPPKYFFIELHSTLLPKKNRSSRDVIEKLVQCGYRVHKSFYRGRKDIAVASTEELLAHPLLEEGYWETFFVYEK